MPDLEDREGEVGEDVQSVNTKLTQLQDRLTQGCSSWPPTHCHISTAGYSGCQCPRC